MKRLYLFFILGFIALGSDALACCGKKNNIVPVLDLADTYITAEQAPTPDQTILNMYLKVKNEHGREIFVCNASAKINNHTRVATILNIDTPKEYRRLGCGTKLGKALLDSLRNQHQCSQIIGTVESDPGLKPKERTKEFKNTLDFFTKKLGFTVKLSKIRKHTEQIDQAELELVFPRTTGAAAAAASEDDDKKSFDPVATVAAE